MEKIKICHKHGELTMNEVYLQYSKYKDKKYPYYSCRACISAKKKRLYDANPKKYIDMSLKTRRKYRDKILVKDKRSKIAKILPLEDYDNLLASQKGLCAICFSLPGSKRLAIDHCHKTNKIRGLLCHHCNTSLGGFKESPDILKAAIEYLLKYL